MPHAMLSFLAAWKKTPMIVLKCTRCDAEYKVRDYRATTAKYCSRRCQALANRIKMTWICANCKKPFIRAAARCSPPKYCSKKCKYEGLKDRGTVTYKCRHCGRRFLGSPSKPRLYCSTAC